MGKGPGVGGRGSGNEGRDCILIKEKPSHLETTPQTPDSGDDAFDLLKVPLVGNLLKQRHARTLLQIPLFLVSIAMIVHGLFGPALAPKNLATTLGWVHFRGALVFTLLFAGNFFCLACPLMLVRNFARRFIQPAFNWPRKLRNKWLAIGLFVSILFSYELFDLWSSPWWTAWLIIGYFAATLFVDLLFKHAAFCKFVCPIGQFNFVASTLSPLEVKVREQPVCNSCATKDCIRGTREKELKLVVIQRGCELALFQPRKTGNLDCTFCLDCVQACPHDNIEILSRTPAAELTFDDRRSGIGVISERKDLAALTILFAFGALLNAFGMVSPVFAVEKFLTSFLHVRSEIPVLGVLFTGFLIIEPCVLLGAASWSMRTITGGRKPLLALAVRYSYGLVPLGFGMWLAHYGFHFLTGLFTFIPVTQDAVASLGTPLLGAPRWSLVGLPKHVVDVIEFGFLGLGVLGSLMTHYRFAETDYPGRSFLAFLPWGVVDLLLWLSAMWLMAQPMQMRGMWGA